MFKSAVAVGSLALGARFIMMNYVEFSADQTSMANVFSSAVSDKFRNGIRNYHGAWDGHDEENERDQSMVDNYFSISTDWYEFGWGKSFHFSHWLRNETFDEATARHEHRIVDSIRIAPGDKILDVGSGVGGPARAIAAYSGAHVTGITINEYQIGRSRELTKEAGLDQQISFVQGDFTKMAAFEDNSFAGAYAIEATCHAPVLVDVYRQVHRVLKPGALFATYEWITTDNYDETDATQRQAIENIEFGSGLPPLRTEKEVLAAAESVGLKLVDYVDLATLVNSETHDWHHRLRAGQVGAWFTHLCCKVSETLGFAAEGTTETHAMLMTALDGLIAGGDDKTFTPMALFVFQKAE